MSQRLRTTATRTAYGQVYDASTPNERDHAFSGIMFDVRCRELLPLSYIEITAVAVRGDLGPMRVFSTKDFERYDFSLATRAPEHWGAPVYSKFHEPSMDQLVKLELAAPVVVESGKSARIYVHSGLTHSSGGRCPDAIVYASQTTSVTTQDQHMQILPGLAHTSPEPFSDVGYWHGPAWRPHRAFVGKLEYGVRHRCWTPHPETHRRFPRRFREMVACVLKCWTRPQGHLWRLPRETLFYVLNMCAWHWAYDDAALTKKWPDVPLTQILLNEARTDAGDDWGRRLPVPQASEIPHEVLDEEEPKETYVDRFGAEIRLTRSERRMYYGASSDEEREEESADEDIAESVSSEDERAEEEDEPPPPGT